MFKVEVLDIYLHGDLIGQLFRFDNGTTTPIIRFVADENLASGHHRWVVSQSMIAENILHQEAHWRDRASERLNGKEGRLPVFFQNMLPEGIFRSHIAEMRACREDDHFSLFAACGLDLPGAVKALPASLTRRELANLVTQENDPLEMSVTADPLPLGVSISGMQPKLGLIEEGGRYVARRRLGVTRIIGKMAQSDRPKLPEVEHLSLQLAEVAGVSVCEHQLVPITKLGIEHGYAMQGSENFLAVKRFDRDGSVRIHCEDFAQALNVDPRNKYQGATYAGMAALMMRYPDSMGSDAVHALLRQVAINDLMGNFDAHLKNFCLIYPDGTTPILSKAFDIVAWSVYWGGHGSALKLYRSSERTKAALLSPSTIREFCARVGIAEKPCISVVKEAVSRAYAFWPNLIEQSSMLDIQKERLLKRLVTHRFYTKSANALT